MYIELRQLRIQQKQKAGLKNLAEREVVLKSMNEKKDESIVQWIGAVEQ